MCLLQGSNVLKMAFERAYGKYRLCLINGSSIL